MGRPSGWQLRVIKRFLAHGARKAGRQLARWIHVAEQHILNRRTRFDPRAPCLENRRHMLGSPLQLERPACQHHQDHRLARRDHGFQQFFLVSGEAEVYAARGFALHPVGGLAERQNRHVGFACRLHCLGDGLAVIRLKAGPHLLRVP